MRIKLLKKNQSANEILRRGNVLMSLSMPGWREVRSRGGPQIIDPRGEGPERRLNRGSMGTKTVGGQFVTSTRIPFAPGPFAGHSSRPSCSRSSGSSLSWPADPPGSPLKTTTFRIVSPSFPTGYPGRSRSDSTLGTGRIRQPLSSHPNGPRCSHPLERNRCVVPVSLRYACGIRPSVQAGCPRA